MPAYLLETYPLDPVSNTEKQTNFASNLPDESYLGRPLPYALRLRSDFSHETGVFPDNIPGNSSASIGSVSLNNADGRFDYLLRYSWGGKKVVFLEGPEDGTYANFNTIFTGSAIEIYSSGNDLILTLRDASWRLIEKLQQNKYDGSGGVGGDVDLQNISKPLCFGWVKNATPVLIDAVKLMYQIHDGPIESIIRGYDDANPLTQVEDLLTYDALNDAVIAPGSYSTCLAQGYIRLGAPAAGTFTVDARGQFYNQVDLSSTLKQILIARTELTVAELDLPSFAELSVDAPYRISGIYYSAPDVQIDEFLEVVVGTVNAFWFVSPEAKIVVRQFKFRNSVLTVRAESLKGLQRIASPKPLHSVVVSYDRNLTGLELSALALPSDMVNGYVTDSIVYIPVDADGNGGDYSYEGEYSVFLNATKINSLQVVTFQRMEGSNKISVTPSGKIHIAPFSGNEVTAVIRANMQQFYAEEPITFRKAFPSTVKGNVTLSARSLLLNQDGTPRDPTAEIIVGFDNPAIAGGIQYLAEDNLDRFVPLQLSGGVKKLRISDIIVYPFLREITITAKYAGQVISSKTVAIFRDNYSIANALGNSTYADGTPIEDLKPATPNATEGAPAGTLVGDREAQQIVTDLDAAGDTLIEQILRVDNQNALIDARTFIEGLPVGAYVLDQKTKRIEGDDLINSKLALIGNVTPDGTAFILNGAAVQSSPGKFLVGTIEQLSATLDGHTATIDQLNEIVLTGTTTTAKAVLRIDNNNHVVGFTLSNNGFEGQMVFVVDTFKIVDPNGGQARTPFSIEEDLVKMTNVEVDTLKVNTAIIPSRITASGTVGAGSNQNILQTSIYMTVPGWVEITAAASQGFNNSTDRPWDFWIQVNGTILNETHVGGTVPGDSVSIQGFYFVDTPQTVTVALIRNAVAGVSVSNRTMFVKGFPNTL